MFQFKIVTDGAADIPLAEAAEKDIKIVPFYVSFDGKDYKKELEELYPGENIICDPLSLSVSCHIGPHSLAIAICKKI